MITETEQNGVPSITRSRTLTISDLGLISYIDCWGLQKNLAAEVTQGESGDTLLLLEHPHTYTCGRSGGRDHILATTEELDAIGAVVLDVDRGGDVTYHGPGQLVAYPIINLFSTYLGRDYRAYLRALEEVLISLLADFGISSVRLEGFSGVWVNGPSGQEKIAAIGVKVDGRGVTSHGVALNVSTNLRYFDRIIPCGIADKGVTSIACCIEAPPSIIEVKAAFAEHFRRVFRFI